MLNALRGVATRRAARATGHAALGWLAARAPEFRIADDRTAQIPWRVKPLGELTLLLVVLKRHGIRARVLEQMAGFVAEEMERFDWHELAAFDPTAATPLALVAEFCRLEGRAAPFEMAHFALLRDVGYFEGLDRVPYRQMDVAYCYSRLGVPDQERRIAAPFAHTAFGRRQHVARYSIADVYSLTHAVMYLTDYGCDPPTRLLDEATLHRLRRTVVDLTGIMLRADNADVLGELLLCWIFGGIAPAGPGRPVFLAGVERMLGAATNAGAIASRRDSRRRADAGEASFAELYHTTLVGALLFSLLPEGAL